MRDPSNWFYSLINNVTSLENLHLSDDEHDEISSTGENNDEVQLNPQSVLVRKFLKNKQIRILIMKERMTYLWKGL